MVPFYVVDSISPKQAKHARTYVVVDRACGETLRSVLSEGAPRTGLRAEEAQTLARFDDATVYKLRPSQKP